MGVIEILREASKRIFENVKDLAGTEDAAGDFGRGAGGDISRNIDIIAEKSVLDYFKENKKVIGKFKDEAAGKVVSEFVGLKSKMYSYLVGSPWFGLKPQDKKKAKGIKKNVSESPRKLVGKLNTHLGKTVSLMVIKDY